MKIIKYSLAVLILFMGVSCTEKKDSGPEYPMEVKISGRVVDAATLGPIPDATIYFDRGGGNPNDTFYSASDGSYSFSFQFDPGYRHAMYAEADHYLGNKNIGIWAVDYPHGKPTPETWLDPWGSSEIDIKLPPEGFLVYHLKHTQPYTGPIQVRITPYNDWGVVTFNGQGLNVKYFDRLPGGAWHYANCGVIRGNDSLEMYRDTLFIPRFDTVTYLIEF